MEFPVLVYTSPGIIDYPGGGSYSFKQVDSELEYNIALESGWYQSSQDAIHPPENDMPTREELIYKANELKIKFSKNISTARLFSLINEQLS